MELNEDINRSKRVTIRSQDKKLTVKLHCNEDKMIATIDWRN